MEKFKKQLKTRVWVTGIYLIAIIAFMIIAKLCHWNDEKLHFIWGFFAGILTVALFYAISAIRALRNKEKLQELYIKEHDEMLAQIAQKTGSTAFKFIIMGLAFAMIAALFFNETVFRTLFWVTIGSSAVVAIIRGYYSRKMYDNEAE